MKAADVITFLMQYLPQFTDIFSDLLNVTFVVVGGDDVDITFDAPHGLSNGDRITIFDAVIDTTIDSIVDIDDIGTFTTATDHDLTQNFQESVQILNTTTSEEFTLPLLTVPNRLTFTASTAGVTITAGDYILLENLQFNNVNGVHNVEVIDTITIRIVVENVNPDISTESIKVVKQIRISGGTDIGRLSNVYESQFSNGGSFENWGFVILDDVEIGKSRRVTRDAQQNQTALNDWNLEMMQNFSFYFFTKSDDKITGRAARDLAEELRTALYSVLLNAEFETGMAIATPISSVVPLGDGMIGYTKSYYIHHYQWQQVVQVSKSDVVDKQPTRAFRDANVQWFNANDIAIIDDEIDLDDDPI